MADLTALVRSTQPQVKSAGEPHHAMTGLTTAEANERLAAVRENRLNTERRIDALGLFLGQFKSPIILILIGAALLSFFLQDHTDAILILAIVLMSGLLGFWQEHSAAHAVARLRAMVETKAQVVRDGREVAIPLGEVVPGDLAVLSAGAIIPGDGRVLEARELFVNEAVLTGETFPVEKRPTEDAASPPGNEARILLGTHVVSGSGKAEILQTGKQTRFGQIAERLRLRRPKTDFEQGVTHFGYLLAEITLVLVLAIFAFNVFLHKPVLDSFLFALALAVGLTPQLLPAIITINLSHGARRMAARKVIVKRLAAIENFGSMNVLCSDKTGTITEGKIEVKATVDARGEESPKVLLYACLNATHETGFVNPIDVAIREHAAPDDSGWAKLDELPYDFGRKRLSILFQHEDRHILITKGALLQILGICSEVEFRDGSRATIEKERPAIEAQWRDFSSQGSRVLGLACREFGPEVSAISRTSESAMVFLGLVVLSDPPKAGIRSTLAELQALGIRLKIITGDNPFIAAQIAREVGLKADPVLCGKDVQTMSDSALLRRATDVDVFAEIEPGQKERLILALKRAGHVVGYMGDGVNDATALHIADVSISVDSAADVAREAADFVMLEHDLNVLVEAVREGRRTFANTLKYVFIATSANFGNMFSMAGASLFLPFLPLLPKQILLMNLLTDLPEMAIATDSVDNELTLQPRRWDIQFIRHFMIVFGLVSSIFDYLTFGVLWWLGATMAQFRTGWFIESIVSAALVVLVVRSRRPFFKSRPGKLLAVATIGVVITAILTPYLPFSAVLGFRPMPAHFYPIIGLIVVAYIATAELTKFFFYPRIKLVSGAPSRHG